MSSGADQAESESMIQQCQSNLYSKIQRDNYWLLNPDVDPGQDERREMDYNELTNSTQRYMTPNTDFPLPLDGSSTQPTNCDHRLQTTAVSVDRIATSPLPWNQSISYRQHFTDKDDLAINEFGMAPSRQMPLLDTRVASSNVIDECSECSRMFERGYPIIPRSGSTVVESDRIRSSTKYTVNYLERITNRYVEQSSQSSLMDCPTQANYNTNIDRFESLTLPSLIQPHPDTTSDLPKMAKYLRTTNTAEGSHHPSRQQRHHQRHIKKPLNAFMLFMKAQRAQVMSECTLKESAAINQILGRRWHALTRDQQAVYYDMAKVEKQLHQQRYPNWSARDNYALHAAKRNRAGKCSIGGGSSNTTSSSSLTSPHSSTSYDKLIGNGGQSTVAMIDNNVDPHKGWWYDRTEEGDEDQTSTDWSGTPVKVHQPNPCYTDAPKTIDQAAFNCASYAMAVHPTISDCSIQQHSDSSITHDNQFWSKMARRSPSLLNWDSSVPDLVQSTNQYFHYGHNRFADSTYCQSNSCPNDCAQCNQHPVPAYDQKDLLPTTLSNSNLFQTTSSNHH